jgi:DNA polymerase III delta prime subunit
MGVPNMRLGEMLVLRGMASIDAVNEALDRQRAMGGRLGDHLVSLGVATQEMLTQIFDETPPMPRSVAETGVSRGGLINLLLKFLRMDSCELLPELSERMRLPHVVVQELIDEAVAGRQLQVLGQTTSGLVRYMRYALSEQGRLDATEALAQNQYLGPAPVSLEAYIAQVNRQSIKRECLDLETLKSGFSGMTVGDHYFRKLLPAVNAGQTVLLYGPPGNGKTTIGLRIASVFRQPVHIPYAIEVSGQIIKLYDHNIHKPFVDEGEKDRPEMQALAARGNLQIEAFDARWMVCKRPVAIAGGELSLDMLELRYDQDAKTYDAPLHMKALNGMFLIDDFGRQKVNPTELLNRWIVPLESRVDYLKLNTGKSFSIPFDELVFFSTNLEPADLMDPAFLRRIPYKIRMFAPTIEEYRDIFIATTQARGLGITEDVFAFIVHQLTGRRAHGLAYFQPRFICEQVMQVCRCFNCPPIITRELAAEALGNLYVESGPEPSDAAGAVVGLPTMARA